MLFERFNNIIEEFSSDLMNNINSERTKSITVQKQILNELLVNKDNAIKILNDLEAEYARKTDTKQKQINSLNHKISQLREELNQSIQAFQIQHDLHPLKQKLMNAKEDKLSDIKQLKKKEINDLTAKINSLDKECLLILKEKDNAIAETEKNHRAKVADLERRMKLEVAKINESILTPVPTAVGKSEEELEDNAFSKQKVKEIRKNGINEIAEVKKKYLEAIYKEKLSFNKVFIQNQHDSKITREEYNIKIAELKYAREKHKRELQLAQDAYDFDTYIIINDTKKQKQLEEKAIVNDYHLRIYRHSDTINRIEVKKNLTNEEYNYLFLDKVNESDILQTKIFSGLFNNNQESLANTIKYFQEYLDKVVTSFNDALIDIINNYWANYYQNEKQFISALIMVNYQISELKDLSFQTAIEEVNQLQQKYQKLQDNRFKKLKNTIESNIKIIQNAIITYTNTIVDYLESETNAANLYFNDINKLINLAYSRNKEAYNQVNINNNKETNLMIENKKNTHDQEINELKNEINQINDAHLSEYNNITNKKKNYDKEFADKEKQILLEHQNYIASVKKNIEALKKKAHDELKTTQLALAKENAIEMKEIEIERRTKLKIGQI